MEKIASFTVNHLDLIPGVYVSRKDYVGKEVLTTFDLRMCAPNREPVMNTAELHTIEHLAATYLRNEPDWKEKIIYFGPMGCRTGCYLILAGDYESKDVVSLVRDTFRFIAEYDGEIKEGEHWSESKVNAELDRILAAAVRAMITRADDDGTSLKQAAFEIALERLVS